MNRPKQYDREVVLEKATALFWEKGFEATSINDLAEKTNINVFSIYNEFGNKDKLFCVCIDNFISNYCQVEEILSKEPLGLINIKAFFEYKARIYDAEYGKGCLVFNSLSQEESLSKEAQAKVDKFILLVETLYYNVLVAAQKNKEISKDSDCKALADYMCNFTYGYVNLGMKKMSKEQLKKSVDLALKVITT